MVASDHNRPVKCNELVVYIGLEPKAAGVRTTNIYTGIKSVICIIS